MIGIIAPLAQEAAALRPKHSKLKQIIPLSEGVLLVISGIGDKNASDAANMLTPRVNHLISWGTAAGLVAGIDAGTILLPNQLATESGAKILTNPILLANIITELPTTLPYDKGLLAESNQVLADIDAKHNFHLQTGAIACDMESVTIGKIAQKHNISFNAIRFVTDDVDSIIPKAVLASMDKDGQLVILKFLLNIVKSPKEIQQVWQLSRSFSKAKAAMSVIRDILLKQNI